MIYFRLFYEFFKIGLFAVGGGMATLPFLQHLSETTGWYPLSLITDIIAISESTPGPIGINMATYTGYQVGGIPGGIIATMGEIIPSVIIVVLVSKSLEKLKGNHLLGDAFYGLRPAVVALIFAAGLTVMRTSFLHIDTFRQLTQALSLVEWNKALLFAAVFLCMLKFKKHPLFYIGVSAAAGILIGL